jgi:hypothetical protein
MLFIRSRYSAPRLTTALTELDISAEFDYYMYSCSQLLFSTTALVTVEYCQLPRLKSHIWRIFYCFSLKLW